MKWQPHLLQCEGRKMGAPPVGLRNLGNTCYLNSVLQCLTYTPPLANLCLQFHHSSVCEKLRQQGGPNSDSGEGRKRRDCPFCILERRIARSLSLDATSDVPSKMSSSLRLYASHFQRGQQEDAHEFLCYVIDSCHNSCLAPEDSTGSSSGRPTPPPPVLKRKRRRMLNAGDSRRNRGWKGLVDEVVMPPILGVDGRVRVAHRDDGQSSSQHARHIQKKRKLSG